MRTEIIAGIKHIFEVKENIPRVNAHYEIGVICKLILLDRRMIESFLRISIDTITISDIKLNPLEIILLVSRHQNLISRLYKITKDFLFTIYYIRIDFHIYSKNIKV